MKLKNILFFTWVIFWGTFLFAQKAPSADYSPDNPDCLYAKDLLGECFIHMSKITAPSKGSAPAFEILFASDFKWEPCEPDAGWGKKGKTYRYRENEVPGTVVFLNVTNKINDVVYYRIEGAHPCTIPLYNDPAEAKILERFIFFKFTAYANKGGFFENYLNNLMCAVDTHTKLLYTYGMPSEYKKIIGNNYIPQKWLPYELHPNTAASKLKFYEYDPIGFVSLEKTHDFLGVKTNAVLYDWWNQSVGAGSNMKAVKQKRFMPRLSEEALTDWTIRDPCKPVRSPYRP